MRIASITLVLLCAGLAAAEPLAVGMRVPELALVDQHDVPGALNVDTRCVVFSRDMPAANIVKESFADDSSLLAAANAVVVSDISTMPSVITKLFALPAMRKRPYRMLLDREGKLTADFPSQQGKVTVLHLKALTIERVEYVESSDALRAALRQVATPSGE